jgi:hypothetical protein
MVLVMHYRNVEFDLPEFNTKDVTVQGSLKIGLTFCSNSLSTAKKCSRPIVLVEGNISTKFDDESSNS